MNDNGDLEYDIDLFIKKYVKTHGELIPSYHFKTQEFNEDIEYVRKYRSQFLRDIENLAKAEDKTLFQQIMRRLKPTAAGYGQYNLKRELAIMQLATLNQPTQAQGGRLNKRRKSRGGKRSYRKYSRRLF